MKQVVSLIALMTLGLGSLPANAENCRNTPVRVGLFEFPPFYSQAESGLAEGILIDELDRVMDKLGCRWQGRFDSASRLLERHVHGETDLLMVIHHPLLLKRARYSRNPVGELHLNSYWIGDKPAASSVEGFSGKKVIVIRGYGYGGMFKQLADPAHQIKLQMAANHRQAFKMLNQQQGDYLLGYERPAQSALDQAPIKDLEKQNISNSDIYFVLSPKYIDQGLIQRLDRILSER